MKIITAINVNQAMLQAIPFMLDHGIEEDSRNGKVLVAPGPVITEYFSPKQRVLFGAERDANPFFHVMESLWMLAGRNDLDFPKYFNSRFGEYSDDGHTVWGAYGHRWREWFGCDQLRMIAGELKRNPNSRRCVLSMWNGWDDRPYDVMSDLHKAFEGGKDVPCNTHAYFDVRGGKLNMTVCCRSNDMIWGAYGANAVHFSFLLEYMAEQIGVPVGVYTQFSNNFHIYLDVYPVEKLLKIEEETARIDMYQKYPALGTVPLNSDNSMFHDDLEALLDSSMVANPNQPSFLCQVAEPMMLAWHCWKDGDYDRAKNHLIRMAPSDWQIAALDWMDRHVAARRLKQTLGGTAHAKDVKSA